LTETLDEYRAASRVSVDAFRMSEDDRRALEAQEELLWGLETSWPHYRTFVAILDGQIVGAAASIYGANAVSLAGGSTREDARGRGAYRALVRARWDAAVERGTPALTVGAESMSRPILERLGFVKVGWTDCLIDRFV
ncbi:MAG: GNAT family N-acetyltransferase, partial [Thermoleophilia bacterium]|nr:GNAT family N-acetyltransferase [Thermoleophilia bacterium]